VGVPIASRMGGTGAFQLFNRERAFPQGDEAPFLRLSLATEPFCAGAFGLVDGLHHGGGRNRFVHVFLAF